MGQIVSHKPKHRRDLLCTDLLLAMEKKWDRISHIHGLVLSPVYFEVEDLVQKAEGGARKYVDLPSL